MFRCFVSKPRDKHLVQDVDEEELIENADCECKPKHTGDSKELLIRKSGELFQTSILKGAGGGKGHQAL